ncbi:MAG: hypothetical protein ACYC35_11625 [Pirellulales bacterium]
MYVRIGYFEDFKGTDTILVCGDEEGLQVLANRLLVLEDASAEPVNLHLLPFVEVCGPVRLTAHPVDRELGVRRVGSSFAWHHSEEGWLESAERIDVVARGLGGHCYLGETPAADAVVMVSKGEYEERWWGRYGGNLGPGPPTSP